MTYSYELDAVLPVTTPPSVRDRAEWVRSSVLRRPTVDGLRVEAAEDPAALLLAVTLDAPRRLAVAARRPAPAYVLVPLLLLALRRR